MSTVRVNGMDDARQALERLQQVLQDLKPIRRQAQLDRLMHPLPADATLEVMPPTLRAAVERLPQVAAIGLLTAVGELSNSADTLQLEFRAGAAQGRVLAAFERDELRENEYHELSEWTRGMALQRLQVLREHA